MYHIFSVRSVGDERERDGCERRVRARMRELASRVARGGRAGTDVGAGAGVGAGTAVARGGRVGT